MGKILAACPWGAQWLGLMLLGLVLAAGFAWAQKPYGPPVVARVGGIDIKLEDFRNQAGFMGLGREPSQMAPELRQAILDKLIGRRLVLAEAARRDIRLDPRDVALVEAGLIEGADQEEFQSQLAFQEHNREVWRQILGEEILQAKTVDFVISAKVRVEPHEIRGYFQSHPEEFERPEQVLLREAILPTLEEAKQVRNRVKKGEDLAEVAAELGCPLPQGDEPVWLGKGYMPAKLEKNIFGLAPGKLGGPVETEYGFHVFEVKDKRPAGRVKLAEAAPGIQKKLSQTKKEALGEKWIEDLRSQAEVWLDPVFLKTGMPSPGGSVK